MSKYDRVYDAGAADDDELATYARIARADDDAGPDVDEDQGRYSGGYRVYRDSSYREDFGADR